MNIFEDQSDFINTDPRNVRPEWIAYKVDAALMQTRHQILIPPEIIKNKKVLDLGSCNGASGAWCLHHGASQYTGIELQKEYVEQSKANLSKYYPKNNWKVFASSIENYIFNTSDKYDIIVALGIIHSFTNFIYFLKKISLLSDLIVIDGTHPVTINSSQFIPNEDKNKFVQSNFYEKFIENEPFIGLHRTGMSLHNKSTLLYQGYAPSMAAIKQIVSTFDMTNTIGVNEKLKSALPHVYSINKKFGLRFKKNSQDAKKNMIGFLDAASSGRLPRFDWTPK
jgi:hypothetical protein